MDSPPGDNSGVFAAVTTRRLSVSQSVSKKIYNYKTSHLVNVVCSKLWLRCNKNTAPEILHSLAVEYYIDVYLDY